MPRDGSGGFTRTVSYAPNTLIDANDHNTEMNDVAAEISNSVARDGQSTMTGNLKMGSNRLTDVATGVARTDAPTLAQVQDGAPWWAGTASFSSNAYSVTVSPGPSAYVPGQTFQFLVANANSGDAPTVNINGIGAKTLRLMSGAVLEAGGLQPNMLVQVAYNGTDFCVLNVRSDVVSFHRIGSPVSAVDITLPAGPAGFRLIAENLVVSTSATSIGLQFGAPTIIAGSEYSYGVLWGSGVSTINYFAGVGTSIGPTPVQIAASAFSFECVLDLAPNTARVRGEHLGIDAAPEWHLRHFFGAVSTPARASVLRIGTSNPMTFGTFLLRGL